MDNIINIENYIPYAPYNMIFRMYKELLDRLCIHDIHKIHDIPNMNKDQFFSTMTMSFICFMRSISDLNNTDKKIFIYNYISNLSSSRLYNSREYKTFFERIFSFFREMPSLEYVASPYSLEYQNVLDYFLVLLCSQPDLSFSYYIIQEKIYNLLCGEYNRFHKEYINIITFGFFTYLQTLQSLNIKDKKYISKYISSLIYINIICSNKINLYDEPELQTIIINLNFNPFYKFKD